MSGAYLIAWLLPIGAGTLCTLALCRRGAAGRVAQALGYGVVLGMLLVAMLASWTARADTAHAWSRAGAWLVLVAIVSGALMWYRSRRRGANAAASTVASASGKVELWKRGAIVLALASLAWRGWLMASELLQRPTYPWDAWVAWAVKSKTWFLLGHYAPFVPIEAWLRDGAAELYSGPAWAYPATLAWLQVWFASAAGDWIEPLVNLPWLALWIGLLLGHYGQWRALGLDRTRAAVAVYLLGSLPLLGSHVALAGYADLWVATLFGFATLAWLRWQEQRDRDQLILALVCAAAMPLLKLEGIVWCVGVLAAIGFGALSTRWRWRAAAIVATLLFVIVLVGQSNMLFAAIGWIRSGSRAIDIPVIGKLSVAWHGDAAIGVVRSLFLQSNWHLLWWLVGPVIVWRWRALRASDSMSVCALLLLGCFALLLFLFVFTDAAEWAESYTAVNRLVMHITPAVVSLLALLLRGPPLFPRTSSPGSSDTARSRAAPPGPA